MIESVIVGSISAITCFIIINCFIPKVKKIQLNKIKIYIVAFFIGFIINLITEVVGFDNWYEDKRYLTAIKMLSS
jgi:hypothetical protein